MSKLAMAAVAAGLLILGTGPADAWYRGGGGAWGGGGHWGDGSGQWSASNGHWSGSYNGHTDSGTYGTTAYGTHYATGSYGGAVATNNGSWGAEKNGQYAYGSHYYGGGTYNTGYHPPTVVNSYYGGGCYNCGGWSGGAVAAGAVAGAAVGVAAGAAVASSAYAAGYAAGTVYAALPAGCVYAPIGGAHALPVQRRLVQPGIWGERDLLLRCGGALERKEGQGSALDPQGAERPQLADNQRPGLHPPLDQRAAHRRATSIPKMTRRSNLPPHDILQVEKCRRESEGWNDRTQNARMP